MNQPKFYFDVNCVEAYKTDDGRAVVEAVVSDNMIDSHGDRMSDGALRRMATQAKVGLPLIDNHHTTFEFGKSFDGVIEELGNGVKRLRVFFALDEDFPQARKLFRELRGGGTDKQLSIGGMLDLSRPGAVKFERDKNTGRTTRVIQRINLEHIAATRPDRAANARTGFMGAVAKCLDDVGLGLAIVQEVAKTYGDHIGALVPLWKSDAQDFVVLSEKELELEALAKFVVPHRAYPLNPSAPWSFSAADGNALVESGGFAMFKTVHTVVRGDKPTPENKGPYALPHHKLASGRLTTFLSGVRAAAGALLGARGGVQGVSAADRAGAAAHLRKHFAEFEVDAPARLVEMSKGLEVEPMSYEEFMAEISKSEPPFELSREEWDAITAPAPSEEQPREETAKGESSMDDDVQAGIDFLAKTGRRIKGNGASVSAPPSSPQKEEPTMMIGKEIQRLTDVYKGVDEIAPTKIGSMQALLKLFSYLRGVIQATLDKEHEHEEDAPSVKDLPMSDQLRQAIAQAGMAKSLNNLSEDEETTLNQLLKDVDAKREDIVSKVAELATGGETPDEKPAEEVKPEEAADEGGEEPAEKAADSGEGDEKPAEEEKAAEEPAADGAEEAAAPAEEPAAEEGAEEEKATDGAEDDVAKATDPGALRSLIEPIVRDILKEVMGETTKSLEGPTTDMVRKGLDAATSEMAQVFSQHEKKIGDDLASLVKALGLLESTVTKMAKVSGVRQGGANLRNHEEQQEDTGSFSGLFLGNMSKLQANQG